jgi:hypothetical protein
MTSSASRIQAVADGTATEQAEEHGLRVLRRVEGQALIRIVCDALWEASKVAGDLHALICDRTTEPVLACGQDQVLEALTCIETAEHYLRMLDEVIDPGDSPVQAEPAVIR